MLIFKFLFSTLFKTSMNKFSSTINHFENTIIEIKTYILSKLFIHYYSIFLCRDWLAHC